jgi:hypothetical protein
MTTAPAAELSAALAGRFVLERELGGGGMSHVFLAREVALGRTVVLKVLADDVAPGVSAERFAREIQLAASLSQANIVPLLSAGDAAGLPFYTMPFVAGDSLRQRMVSGRVPAAESIAILRDIARALAYAHQRGVAHRDIKPENVLLSHGAAVVTDFGIAKAIAAARESSPNVERGRTLTAVGSSIGTPAYMSPEQAVGDVVDARSDVYSWGVVAYELLAGRHPFADRATAPSLIAAHVSEVAAPLLEVLPAELRRDLEIQRMVRVVMRCLAKRSTDRPESGAALLGALDDRSTSGRSRARVGVLTGVGLAIAIAGVFGLTRRAHQPAGTTGRLNPKRVVVATFVNRTGDASLAPVGLMAADWIARGLSTAQVVEVAGTEADLASRGSASRDSGSASRAALAESAGAGLVIAGTYYRQGDSVLLQADILDANDRGKLIQTIGPIAALSTAPLAGVEAMRQRVVGGLAVLVDSSLGPFASQSTTMPSYDAYREFLQGEALYYRDPASAREHYTSAAALDSNYQWPVLRLVNNAFDAGDGRRMDSLIAVLRARRARLSPYEGAYLDLMSCGQDAGQAEQCIDITRAMRRAAPRSQFAAYMQALVLRQFNRPFAAESVFRSLDRQRGEMRGREFLFLHYASTELQLGRDSLALSLAREGDAVAGRRSALLYFELAALARMRRFDEMNRVFDSVWAESPDRRAGVFPHSAFVLYVLRHQGDSAEATAFGARLFAALASRTPSEANSPRGWGDRAALLMAMHRWAELDALTDSMVRAGDDRVPTLEARGVALAALGRRLEAMSVVGRLEHPTRRVEPKDGCSLAWAVCRTASRATILAMLGRRAEAMAILNDRMYRIFVNWYADFGLLGELLRGEPAFEEYIRPR